MKTFYLILVCFFFCGHIFGRIRNGYEADLESYQASLLRLNAVLLEERGMAGQQKLVLKERINKLITHLACYKLTEELIHRFRMVCPEVFNEMNNLTDKRGRLTDIYVRIVPRENSRMEFRAASFFEPSPMDEDANHSEHGDLSVAIDVWIDDNALFLLSHEFGHVKYIVPHVASYTRFYSSRYSQFRISSNVMGHGAGDQSGKSALLYEKKYMEAKRNYFDEGGKKQEALTAMFGRFRRSIRSLTDPDAIAVAKSYR